MFKNIFFTILSFVFTINNVLAFSKEDILPTSDTAISDTSGLDKGESGISFILEYVKDTIFNLLMLVAVASFMYVGYQLFMARGNPEEFKKAIQSFVYAIIGILFVGMAYVLVAFISGLQF